MSTLDMIFVPLLPIVFLIVGIIMTTGKVRKNVWFGWRTKAAMVNEETFHYANRIGGKGMVALGTVELIFSLLCMYCMGHQVQDNIMALWIILIQLALFLILIYAVERKLKTK